MTTIPTINRYRQVIEGIVIGGLSADTQAEAVSLLDALEWERSFFFQDVAAMARHHDLVDRYGADSAVARCHDMEHPRLFAGDA